MEMFVVSSTIIRKNMNKGSFEEERTRTDYATNFAAAKEFAERQFARRKAETPPYRGYKTHISANVVRYESDENGMFLPMENVYSLSETI